MIAAHNLLLGGGFDLMVNLDGFNEVGNSAGRNFQNGVFPFFPLWWANRVGLTGEEVLLAGPIGVLRREQERRAAAREKSPLRWSALFGLLNRYRQERTAAEIIRLNHQLAATQSAYRLEKHGPGGWPERAAAAFAETARVWYRSSLILAGLAEGAGAEYYHFLQPNQYVPHAKLLSAAERERAYAPHAADGLSVVRGYPQLRQFNRDLTAQGVNYFDLTGGFVGHSETLYIDECCHLNARGNELLAAAMRRRLEPALRRLGTESPAAPFSPAGTATPPEIPGFQVSVPDGGQYLRYLRETCAAADTAAGFFLHIIPADAADLPAERRDAGFVHLGFDFAQRGGHFAGKCLAVVPLPDYAIREMRTGQHIRGAADPLWSARLVTAPDRDRLRADYAAVAAAEPVVRDYFDLYLRDDRLVYVRETCAAGDTAAGFFLHIVPADVADLPADRRDAGFAHGGFDFRRWGGHFDGKCLAAVALPDYPIAGLRTGQYVPGQGELWSAELRAGP